MYIQVRLLSGYSEPLWYHASKTHTTSLLGPGAIVRVPLQARVVPAVVVRQQAYQPKTAFALRDIECIEPFPRDVRYQEFLTRLARYHCIDSVLFLRRLAHFLGERALRNKPGDVEQKQITRDVCLTDEQQVVVDFLKPQIEQPVYTPTVVHGVTGSGKTEIYKSLFMHAIAQKKSALLLLPEVTLALELERRLQRELGNALPIVGFHSGVGAAEKYRVWQKLVAGDQVVIVGVHMPVLLPMGNLGLIVVDEEHETGYQEKKHPKINSRDAAVMRAHCYGIPILLGSATPSVSTLHNVEKRGWHLFHIRKRFSGTFPLVRTVCLADGKQRQNFWISTELAAAIRERLARREQTILFLNRRGLGFFVQCKGCSFVFQCGACSVSLTIHEGERLRCHYCGVSCALPQACPECKADDKQLLKRGIGTQQVVKIVQQLFPAVRVERADRDATVQRKRWQETVRRMHAGEIDILVGTQTVTKGYDFPNVTLVGVLWADLDLNVPIYNASETTLQQLIQVAGRAGRRGQEGEVIVQSMGDDPIFNFLSEQTYPDFYTKEIEARKQLQYPPCGRLMEIELRHAREEVVEREAHELCEQLRQHASGDVRILGPVSPPISKIKNVYIRKIYLKAPSMVALQRAVTGVTGNLRQSHYFITPNPVS